MFDTKMIQKWGIREENYSRRIWYSIDRGPTGRQDHLDEARKTQLYLNTLVLLKLVT